MYSKSPPENNGCALPQVAEGGFTLRSHADRHPSSLATPVQDRTRLRERVVLERLRQTNELPSHSLTFLLACGAYYIATDPFWCPGASWRPRYWSQLLRFRFKRARLHLAKRTARQRQSVDFCCSSDRTVDQGTACRAEPPGRSVALGHQYIPQQLECRH